MRYVRARGANQDWQEPGGRERAFARARVPERYWRASRDCLARIAPAMARWLDATLVSSWLAEGIGHYCAGPLGAGKSSLAALLVEDALARGEAALWLPVRDVPSVRFRATPDAAALDDRLATTDLLVLDDLGAEGWRLDGPAGAALEAAVRIAYDRARPVIVTSNLAWQDAAATYPAPLVSVLGRCCRPVAWVA